MNIELKFISISISESIRLFRKIFKGPLSVVSFGRNGFLHPLNPKPEATILVKTTDALLERKISSHIHEDQKMVSVDQQGRIERRHSWTATTSFKPDNVPKMISDPLTFISVANLEMQPMLNASKSRSISF